MTSKKFDDEGYRLQSRAVPADDKLPFLRPGVKCNSRMARADGYCQLLAGAGTDHEGYGRCKLHGGIHKPDSVRDDDGPLALFRAAGLDQIINMAETMTGGDAEYLFHVGNNALVVTRSGIIAKMQSPDVSPKELADMTMALTRIDTILSKFPDEENPDAAPNKPESSIEAEMDKLTELEASLREEI